MKPNDNHIESLLIRLGSDDALVAEIQNVIERPDAVIELLASHGYPLTRQEWDEIIGADDLSEEALGAMSGGVVWGKEIGPIVRGLKERNERLRLERAAQQ